MREINLDTPCIEWGGAINKRTGYGGRWINGRTTSAHRAAYIEAYGEESVVGLVVDHICENRACVNILHLQAITQQANVLKGKSFAAKNATKTHCAQGHKFSPENVYEWDNERRCRKCHRQVNREWARRKREELRQQKSSSA